MKKRYKFLINGVFLSGILLGNVLPAFALGETNPLSFQGNGSRVIDTGTPSAMLPVSVMAQDISSIVNTTSSVTYSGNNVSAEATTSDYGYSGSISASGYNTAWRSGGYFHDEISFGSVNSGTYTIDFVFDVNASAELYDNSGRTDLTMTMSYWDGYSYTSLDTKYLLSVSGNGGSEAVSGAYHLSLTGIDYTDLVESGHQSFLPYTIGLWGDAVNGSLSWTDVVLADVIVTDESGAILVPGSYELQSDSLAFNAVTSDVPLPGAIWLLGFGFAGFAGLRGRENCQLS